MNLRAFYENETAKKQLNELGLFDKARKFMRIKGEKVFFDSRILSNVDLEGKKAGFGTAKIKEIVILELQGKING